MLMTNSIAEAYRDLDDISASFCINHDGKVVAATVGSARRAASKTTSRRRWRSGQGAATQQVGEARGAGEVSGADEECIYSSIRGIGCFDSCLRACFSRPACLARRPGTDRDQNRCRSLLFPEQLTLPQASRARWRCTFAWQELHVTRTRPAIGLIPARLLDSRRAGSKLVAATYPTGRSSLCRWIRRPTKRVHSKFIIQARIAAAPGNHIVQGRLRSRPATRANVSEDDQRCNRHNWKIAAAP